MESLLLFFFNPCQGNGFAQSCNDRLTLEHFGQLVRECGPEVHLIFFNFVCVLENVLPTATISRTHYEKF